MGGEERRTPSTDVRWIDELKKRLPDGVQTSARALDDASHDHGGVVLRRPAAVVTPRTVEEAVAAVNLAREYRIPVSTRGTGHSAHGHALNEGGIILRTSLLDALEQPDVSTRTIRVQGGATWDAVVRATSAASLLPPVLVDHLPLSVAGTLSTGGIGAQSFHYGLQVDNVQELEVLTGTGEVVSCSRTKLPELFDAARGGLGQCGVVLSATLALRPFKPLLKTWRFEYDEVEPFFDDLLALSADPRVDHIASALREREGEGRVSTGGLLLVGVEHDAGDDPPSFGPLRSARNQVNSSVPLLEEDARFREPFFSFRHEPPRPGAVSTGVRAFFEPSRLRALVAELESQEVVLDHALVQPVLTMSSPAPLLRQSAGLLLSLSVIGTVEGSDGPAWLEFLESLGNATTLAGGARYLHGYVPWKSVSQWAAHYGPAWEDYVVRKNHFDPEGIFNPAFIRWRDEG